MAVELIRLLLVSTGVLVMVLAFAASVKFIADGRLAPADVPRFMGYAVVPMLAYALPFASCFAATIVYHRLASDNEAQAAASGGVSHRVLLLPAALVGLLLALALAALNEEVIPRFLRGMQQLITQDVARLLLNSVKRGESLALGARSIYAEQAWELRESKPGAEQFALQRAVLVEFDAEGRPVMQGTAELVYVLLSRVDRPAGSQTTTMTRVVCTARNLVGRDRDRALVHTDAAPFTAEIPDAFEDDPKFLTFGELRELRDHPERQNFIERRRRTLALETARLRVIDDLQKGAAESGLIVLDEPAEQRTVSIECSGLLHDPSDPPGVYRVLPPRGKASLSLVKSAGRDARGSGGAFRVEAPVIRLLASSADEVGAAAGAPTPPVQFRFEIPRGKMFAVGAEGREEEQNTAKDLTFSGMTPRAATLSDLQQLDVPGLLREAERTAAATKGDPTPVRLAAADLETKERDLQREVTSKQHERMAQNVCTLLMILTGAVVALRLSLRQPLTVYLWSFLPALICYITIAGGQQTTHSRGDSGLILLWSGVAGLAAYTLLSFRSVARH